MRGKNTANATDMKDHKKLLGRRVKWHPALKCWISFLTHSDPRHLWNSSMHQLLCLHNTHVCSQQPRDVGPVTIITRRDVNFLVSHTFNSRDKNLCPQLSEAQPPPNGSPWGSCSTTKIIVMRHGFKMALHLSSCNSHGLKIRKTSLQRF